MKENILMIKEVATKEINAGIENYIVENIYTVPYGKGVRKDQLMITVMKKGEYTANMIFNTDTMEYVKCKPLGKYTKHEILMMDCDLYVLFNKNMKSIIVDMADGLKEVNESIPVISGYTVGNRTFNDYDTAMAYCIGNDWDVEEMLVG